MSSSSVPKEVTTDLISFDVEPELPTNEIAEASPEPTGVDALLTQGSEFPDPIFNGTVPKGSIERLDLKEMVNLLRLMSRFTGFLGVDKIIATSELLTGKLCTTALLIEALQQMEAAENIKDGNVRLRGLRPEKYVEKGYLVNSVADYVRDPVVAFDYLLQNQGEKTVLIYDMELSSFSSPNEFVIRRSKAVDKRMNYLRQVDSVYWFPARKMLKKGFPCLVAEKKGDDLKRAIFLCSYTDGNGLFYLVDLDKEVLASLQHSFLIPERIFQCHVTVYRVRLAFVRPFYGSLWAKAVVDKVKDCLEQRPFQVAFAGLEEHVKPVFIFKSDMPLFEDLLHLPSATFNLLEMITYGNLEALEVMFGGSVRPLRKLREIYFKNQGYFDVFESCYKVVLKGKLYDKRGQLKIDSSLLDHCARHVRRYFVGAFKDVSCELNDSWYHECLKSERRLMAVSKCFAEAHLSVDNTPDLYNLAGNIELSADEFLCSQFKSLFVSSSKFT